MLKLPGSRTWDSKSYAAGILDNSPAIQGVYITLMCFVEPARAGVAVSALG